MNAQKERGIVYTPAWIVDKILDEAGYAAGGSVIDPACGDGAFLSAIVGRILNGAGSVAEKRRRLTSNVVGMDIDADAVAACKKRLSAQASAAGIKNVRWKIFHQDALDHAAMKKWHGQFDFVVGNPPYVRIQHLGKTRRERLQRDWSFCHSGSTDIYIAFFEMALLLLGKGGVLGFITPNTWLKTRAAKLLRRHLQRRQLVKTLIDFEHHQLFENITTYSLIAILAADGGNARFQLIKGDGGGAFKRLGEVPIADMDENNWVLCSAATHGKLRKMLRAGTPLGAFANIHVGLTTLADNCYIFRAPAFDGQVALIQHPLSGGTVEVEKAILRPIIKASVLKSGRDNQQRHILFPYQKRDGRQQLIEEEEMRAVYPLAHAYLKSIKQLLDKCDKGKPNPVGWYAFGRSQGLETAFGRKILTSPMNLRPNFIVWDKPEYAFYSGYCIKYDGDLQWLAAQLNSEKMAFYISTVSRHYQNNYKSFAKSFLCEFPLDKPAQNTGLDLPLVC